MRGTGLVLLAVLVAAGCDEKGYPGDTSTSDGWDISDTRSDSPFDVSDDPERERRCWTDEDCEDDNPCTDNQCNVEDDRCFWTPYDDDGDGFGPMEREGADCGGSDCDDTRDDINPDAPPGCEDLDFNCDTVPDNDTDEDGYGSIMCGGIDCDDTDDTIHPGATEICDTIDQDCDDLLTDAPNADDDSDLHLDEGCGGDDCDDTRDDVYTGAPEICGDGVDQDCNTIPDDATSPIMTDARITNDTDSSRDTSLVWTGSQYGVAWNDDRDGNWEIYLARIDADGSKIGSDVKITDAVTSSKNPSLVWTGSQFGISWNDHRDGNEEIYFARIDTAGAKVGSDVRITDDVARSRFPALVWADGEYGVSWSDNRTGNEEITFARISAAGAKIGADVQVTFNSYTSFEPASAWSGSEYAVCWRDDRDGNEELYCTRMSSAGAKVGSDIRITNAPNASGAPSIVWTGSEYGLCWHDQRNDTSPSTSPYQYEIYFARLGTDVTKLSVDERITTTTDTSWYPSLVWMTSTYAVSWHDRRDGNGEIYFARITASGAKIVPDVRVTTDTGESWNPSITWTGSEFGVSWDDDRDGNEEIYFNRIYLCE